MSLPTLRLGLILATIMGVTALLAPPARSGPIQALVPAYFYPNGTGLDDWNELNWAASQIGITAILNPASGPGTIQDPNYVTVVDNLRAAGGNVIGYVATAYGDTSIRPLSVVEAEIDRYLSFYDLDGFFIDQMSSSPTQLAYYQQIYSYIKSKSADYTVFGNPGTNTDESYLSGSAADTLVIYENDNAVFPYSSFTPSPWVSTFDSNHFASIVYNVPDVTTMADIVSLARQKNSGYLYVTDDTSPNPYDTLPTYWREQVALMAVPEPSSILLGALAGSILCLARRGLRSAARSRRV